MSQRTFLALDLHPSVLDRLGRAREAMHDPDAAVRWVDRDNLHLTLLFLGDVPDERLAGVCDSAAGAAAAIEPFEFHLRGIQCVPPKGPLRMVWAGVEEPTGRLMELQAGLAAALAGLGLRQEDRAFRPHITLARVKNGGRPRHGDSANNSAASEGLRQLALAQQDADFGPTFAEEVVIYGSVLTPEGPLYTPTARAPLGV